MKTLQTNKKKTAGGIDQISTKILMKLIFFMEKKSKSDALASFTKYIYTNLDKSKLTIAVFLNFSKAFDTVKRET